MEKYIGLVKWFHDQAKNANYGFIQHAVLGDLFFHQKSIEQGQNINSFKENEVVVFISQVSKKDSNKLEAVQVRLLANENDLNFIFNHFLLILTERGKYSDYNTIQAAVHTRIKQLLVKSGDTKIIDELFYTYQSFGLDQLLTSKSDDISFLKGFLRICHNIFPERLNEIVTAVKTKISDKIAHRLWLDNFIKVCDIGYVSEIINSSDQNSRQIIFGRCSTDEKINIFFKFLSDIEFIDTRVKLERIKEILNLCKEFAIDQYDKILKETLKNCSTHFKLDLWLEDYHQELQFEEFKMYTITLNPSDQLKFVKKTLKYIHEGKVQVSVDELTSINIIDYETSKLAGNFTNSKLDYSTSIILNTVQELNNQNHIETRKDEREAKNRMFDIILSQIKEPTDILEISGYFDECEGRCTVSTQEIKDESGIVIDVKITYHRNEYQKARLHPVCDGRKFLKDGLPVLDEKSNQEFWWCANEKCFKPSRALHSPDEWEKYTLYDFLNILKVNYREKDFEIYLNIINKANRFLKHLKCRECDHILRPMRQSNYAFYGTNSFNCANDNCKEKGKEIYITHCLNGKCEQEIDSRDSVKCRPDGVDSEKCGWYVCNYCLSCCSDEVINARIANLTIRGQEYRCHTKGHRNLGVISCNKCGNAMESNKVNAEQYQKTLDWFVRNKEKSEHIIKSGVTKNNKIWFLFAKNELSSEDYNSKLINLLSQGFQIPNIIEDRDVQLISEPNDINRRNSDILICKHCKNIIDLSSDRERAETFKSFHNVRYAKQAVEV